MELIIGRHESTNKLRVIKDGIEKVYYDLPSVPNDVKSIHCTLNTIAFDKIELKALDGLTKVNKKHVSSRKFISPSDTVQLGKNGYILPLNEIISRELPNYLNTINTLSSNVVGLNSTGNKKNDVFLHVLSWLFSGISTVSWLYSNAYENNKLPLMALTIISLIITVIAIYLILRNIFSSGFSLKKVLLSLIPIFLIGGLAYFLISPKIKTIISKNNAIIEQLKKDMVKVDGGSFYMGATSEQIDEAKENEKPSHSVSLPDFYICKYEVTQELWNAIMGNNPSELKGDKLPVVFVSYDDCLKFIKLLNKKTGENYRLPTEEEWEYAARGGKRKNGYKFAGSDDLRKVGWYRKNSGRIIREVCQKDSNELGLYDMSGNVFEWCQNEYKLYTGEPLPDSLMLDTTEFFSMRGGSVYSDASFTRVSYRKFAERTKSTKAIGFRLAKSL